LAGKAQRGSGSLRLDEVVDEEMAGVSGATGLLRCQVGARPGPAYRVRFSFQGRPKSINIFTDARSWSTKLDVCLSSYEWDIFHAALGSMFTAPAECGQNEVPCE
jgi:hypothetical protein